jgi:hypothetical protein
MSNALRSRTPGLLPFSSTNIMPADKVGRPAPTGDQLGPELDLGDMASTFGNHFSSRIILDETPCAFRREHRA